MLLYHKCNKDMVQLDINQASKATISSVPLAAGAKVNDCIQKGFVQKYMFPPKNDSWNIFKNEPCKNWNIVKK